MRRFGVFGVGCVRLGRRGGVCAWVLGGREGGPALPYPKTGMFRAAYLI